MTRKERYQFIIQYFSQHVPIAETELMYSNPFELLVAVILSAQCTDKRVNLTTPTFFKRFPDALTLSEASVDEVFSLIRSISYPNNKAKHLVGMAQMLTQNFQNIVPSNVEDLMTLPGVGRKTANVIASVVYNLPKMAVDTHVFRVSARIGLTVGAKNPLQAELQLMKYLPKEIVPIAHHWLILHGRYVCIARSPKCSDCGLTAICAFYSKKTKSAISMNKTK